jgi:mycothiol maleylpyruvate isomerase-like protein
MPLASPEPIDTRPLFRPVSGSLVTLLRGLPSESWNRSTVAGAWVVRDVVAHLLDSMLRRLSFHRDGMTPPPPPNAITSERDFLAFINDLNAQWVRSAKRLSPRVLTDLYERASREAADWFESLPLEAPR